MERGIKWFVEIIQERRQAARVERCESLREARAVAERAEAATDFDPATDSIAIYRGKTWHDAKLFE